MKSSEWTLRSFKDSYGDQLSSRQRHRFNRVALSGDRRSNGLLSSGCIKYILQGGTNNVTCRIGFTDDNHTEIAKRTEDGKNDIECFDTNQVERVKEQTRRYEEVYNEALEELRNHKKDSKKRIQELNSKLESLRQHLLDCETHQEQKHVQQEIQNIKKDIEGEKGIVQKIENVERKQTTTNE